MAGVKLISAVGKGDPRYVAESATVNSQVDEPGPPGQPIRPSLFLSAGAYYGRAVTFADKNVTARP
jgi:hypothetical protein